MKNTFTGLRRECIARFAGRLFRIPAALLLVAVLMPRAQAATVILHDIDSGLTSPSGSYRWLDIANQAYSGWYREGASDADYDGYNYTEATVSVDYTGGSMLAGTLTASDLKPNFAYQLKLVGTPGTPSNEGIGLAGRWWQEEWNGSAWSNGQNLNNKGDGSAPNPNDVTYLLRRDIPDATSPTEKHYRYTAYLVMDYFETGEDGAASLGFAADSSYHVLWKDLWTTHAQASHTADDGPEKASTFDPDPLIHTAYDVDYGENTVTIFGEWERLPVGGVYLSPGDYTAQIMLTEESFHGDGGTYAGNWAAAMGGAIEFSIVPEPMSMVFFGTGLVGVVGYVARKRTRN